MDANARQVAGTVAGTLLGSVVLLGLERQAQAQDRPGDRDRQAQPRGGKQDPAGPSARDERTAGPRHVCGPEGPASPPNLLARASVRCVASRFARKPVPMNHLRTVRSSMAHKVGLAGVVGPCVQSRNANMTVGRVSSGGRAARWSTSAWATARWSAKRGPAPMVGSWVRSRHAAMTVIRVSSDGRPVPAGRLRGVRSSMDRNAIMD